MCFFLLGLRHKKSLHRSASSTNEKYKSRNESIIWCKRLGDRLSSLLLYCLAIRITLTGLGICSQQSFHGVGNFASKLLIRVHRVAGQKFYVSRQRLYSNKFYDSINTGAVLTSKQTKIVILTSSRNFPNSHVTVNVHHFSWFLSQTKQINRVNRKWRLNPKL